MVRRLEYCRRDMWNVRFRKYEIKVTLDLHAAPVSQNGNDYSASGDGSQEWGRTDDSIHQTVNAISFLTAREPKFVCSGTNQRATFPWSVSRDLDKVLSTRIQ